MIELLYDSAAVEKDGTISAYVKAYDGANLIKNICVQGKDKEELKSKLRAQVEALSTAAKTVETQKEAARAAVDELRAELSAVREA